MARESVVQALERPSEGLLRALVHATYWLDDGLQAHMRAHAGLSLPRAQSMLMVYLTEGVNRQLDLAERLQVSKQAIRQAVKELEAKGIVKLHKDPANGRQKLVQLTEHGRALGEVAREGLAKLEAVLSARLGAERMRALRDALFADWGSVPQPDGEDRHRVAR